MDEFPCFLAEAVMTSGQLLVIGDFNIHMKSESRESEQFISLLHTHNLTQHVPSPTYRRGHVLDLVITRTDAKVISNVSVTNPMISDQSVVMITLPTSTPSRPEKINFEVSKNLTKMLLKLTYVLHCSSLALCSLLMKSCISLLLSSLNY